MREFGKIITRKTDLTDAQVQQKYKFPAIIILHDNEDQILKITHYQKNGIKSIYDFSQSASKQFVTDSIATAIAGLEDNSTDSIGSRGQQLSLSSVFRINQDGNANKVDVTAGVLFSQTLDKTWNVSALVSTIPDNDYRYVYVKASKTTSTASIYLSKNQISFDSDVNDYYFLVGILHSVVDGVRVLSITVGTTTISGGLVRTGIISSLDGLTSFNLNTGEIKGKITFSSGSSGYENLSDKPDLSSFEATRDYVNSTLQTDLADLKNRADGVIESWFYSHTPTLLNLPASNWLTTEERNAHIGDTFTNMQEFVDNVSTPDAGKAWRFVKNETTGDFSWSLIANSDSTKALIEAGKAKDTADAKRRVFVSQPYPPYNIGDLWVQGNGGDIMRCKFERLSGSFVATDFEKASKYTDDTAVNNLQIGGRNYVLDSERERVFSAMEIGKLNGFTGGETITLSFEAKYVGVDILSIQILNEGIVYGGTQLLRINVSSPNYTKYSQTITLPASLDNLRLVGWLGSNGTGTGYAKKFKVEKGNKATDWTPAPEDVEASIEKSKQDSINASKAYADAQNEVKRIEIEAYADGIVTAAEQRALNDATNKAEAAKTYATAQDALLKTQLESYADGVVDAEEQARINQAQSNLNAAKAYADAQDNLAKIAANAYADGVVSEEEARAIADATAKMEAAKNHAQTLVNNLQIGGRNLLIGTKDMSGNLNSPYNTSDKYLDFTIARGTNNSSYIDLFEANTSIIPTGDFYVVSFYAKASANVSINCYFYNPNTTIYSESSTGHSGTSSDGASSVNVTTEWKRYWVKWNQTTPTLIKRVLVGRLATIGVTLEICGIMFSSGNKHLDWTPAPEDIDSAISTAQDSADTANNLLADIANDNILTPSEKQSTKKEWDIIVGEKSVVESQANTLGVSTTSYVNAYNSLNSYITPLLADLTVNSAIVGSDFRANFKNYYDAKIALLKAVTDKLKSNTDNLQNQLDSESAKVINLENKTDFLTGTTVEGNAIATGTLLVGNSEGTNAGLTGLGTEDEIFLWGGSTFANRNNAKVWLKRNGHFRFISPNGLSFDSQTGTITNRYLDTAGNPLSLFIGTNASGNPEMTFYDRNGNITFRMNPNGIDFPNEVPESWTAVSLKSAGNTIARPLNSTTRAQMIDIIKAWVCYDDTLGIYAIKSNDLVAYDYFAGRTAYSEGYRQYEGLKTSNISRTSNIADGWYYNSSGYLMTDIETNQPLVELFYISGGKKVYSEVLKLPKYGTKGGGYLYIPCN